jgi:hypothetical protein
VGDAQGVVAVSRLGQECPESYQDPLAKGEEALAPGGGEGDVEILPPGIARGIERGNLLPGLDFPKAKGPLPESLQGLEGKMGTALPEGGQALPGPAKGARQEKGGRDLPKEVRARLHLRLSPRREGDVSLAVDGTKVGVFEVAVAQEEQTKPSLPGGIKEHENSRGWGDGGDLPRPVLRILSPVLA